MLYAAFCIAKGRILQCERRSIARCFTVNCNADFIFPHFTVICRIFQQTVGYAAVNQQRANCIA